MIEKIFNQSKYFAATGNSAINYFMNFGMNPSYAVLILGGFAILSVFIIFYLCISYSLLTLFATAGVIGRVATYHRTYDNIMLIFLLLAVIKITWIKPDKFNFIMLILVGLSLWLPNGFLDFNFDYLTSFQFIIWLASCSWIPSVSGKETQSGD